MKFALKMPTGKPRREKIAFDAALAEQFDAYVQFHQKESSLPFTTQQVIVYMLTTFMQSDRDFRCWYRTQTGLTQPPKAFIT